MTSLLPSVMVKQPIIQEAISYMEAFNGPKSKFESWIGSVENAAQISGQNILCIAFLKMVGSSLMSSDRLRDCLSHLTWDDIKHELLRQYSMIPFGSQATQAFTDLQQGCNELLKLYLHHATELLSKIQYMTDMSQIPAEGLNHYTMVYGLNSNKLKDQVVRH